MFVCDGGDLIKSEMKINLPSSIKSLHQQEATSLLLTHQSFNIEQPRINKYSLDVCEWVCVCVMI